MKVELFKLYAVSKYALKINTYIFVLIVLTDTFRMRRIMCSSVDLI